jgi:hypothetical protein
MLSLLPRRGYLTTAAIPTIAVTDWTMTTRQTPSYRKREQTAGIRNVQRYAAIPKDERETIARYCADHQISVSQYISELLLRNIRYTGEKLQKPITEVFDYHELTKLEYHSMMLGLTPEQLIKKALIPILNKQKIWTTKPHMALRYVVTAKEDREIRAYLRKHKLSARHYPGLLAMKVAKYYFADNKERRNFPWNK